MCKHNMYIWSDYLGSWGSGYRWFRIVHELMLIEGKWWVYVSSLYYCLYFGLKFTNNKLLFLFAYFWSLKFRFGAKKEFLKKCALEKFEVQGCMVGWPKPNGLSENEFFEPGSPVLMSFHTMCFPSSSDYFSMTGKKDWVSWFGLMDSSSFLYCQTGSSDSAVASSRECWDEALSATPGLPFSGPRSTFGFVWTCSLDEDRHVFFSEDSTWAKNFLFCLLNSSPGSRKFLSS